MAGRRHDSLVEWLQKKDPSVQTKGFRAAVKAMLEQELGIEVEDQLSWLSMIPDAYRVSPGQVVAYEVEDTHRVSRKKMLKYARLWYGFRELGDDELLEFRLVIMDIRGGVIEPDLAAWWYQG